MPVLYWFVYLISVLFLGGYEIFNFYNHINNIIYFKFRNITLDNILNYLKQELMETDYLIKELFYGLTVRCEILFTYFCFYLS